MDVHPDSVTTDDHGSYPRAIRTVLGRRVQHRTSPYPNNRLEQDHRGIKGRIRCMRGFKIHYAAARFCREHGEFPNLLRRRRRHKQIVPAFLGRSRFVKAAHIALDIMRVAQRDTAHTVAMLRLMQDLTEPHEARWGAGLLRSFSSVYARRPTMPSLLLPDMTAEIKKLCGANLLQMFRIFALNELDQ
jgi:hypothetical protein